ncbi:GxxExxY protein [Candidatus Uhrbacteria bacterium]|nr:GxxExxY protein [Candidatus Uhrbacteria bacterium]
MQPKPKVRRADLVEPELSYDTVGGVLDVFHELGPGLKESVYQKSVAKALRLRNIPFQQQVYCPVKYRGERVGSIFLDFLIASKIVLELKRGEYFSRAHIQQVKEYLQITGLQLAIIATITHRGVTFRRIVNIRNRPK